MKLQERHGREKLAISTLRGQLADNREWSRDPSRPAIIIGTADLIGSALLFSGYRSGFKTKPLHAGLLGQDSLLVLDEAHLSKPFEKLIKSITAFQKSNDKPMRVIRMSATSRESGDEKPFMLDTDSTSPTYDLWSKIEDGREANPIKQRFEAVKQLKIETTADVINSIATAVGKIASEKPGTRIVIFVKSPKDVDAVRKALIKNDKSRETKIAQLTGTMRGLERDQLVDVDTPLKEDQHERRIMQRFLKPENDPSLGECFLISTSAGEVGFDLNADHLVGDEAPLDSWIQRLGRVNRRGSGDAVVVFVRQEEPADKTDFDKACIATSRLLSANVDVSPKSLAAFKRSLGRDPLKAASTPEPVMVELTDILLDAWSMTSITESMPGRPEVAPWLRGIAEDLPQTTIAWRAELDLFEGVENAVARKALKAIFAKHPIRPHESLTTGSRRVIEFFNQVKKKRPDLLGTRVVITLTHDILIRTIQQIIDDDGILNTDPTLILPASFGGLEKGMLSHEAIPPTQKLDVADHEGYEQTEEARARMRILIERTDEGWKAARLPGGEEIPTDLELGPYYEKSTELFNNLKKRNFRVRLVQPVNVDDEGDAVKSLVVLAPAVKGKKQDDQSLIEHVGGVETEARRIADAMNLIDPIRSALLFAAQWHDEGKKADNWQYFIGYRSGEPLGKGKSPRDPKLLKGYRHEFGSLLRIQHPERCGTTGCTPPAADACDLALHLITTHHGMGRPHFNNAIYAEFTDEERDAIHIESIRRFARLQKQYGHWCLAWLENLLRCADAVASAQAGSTGGEDELEEVA